MAGYNSGPPVLDTLSFSATAGEVLAVLGRNGAGKTTLLRCISGLLRPRSGTVSISGVDMTGDAPHTIAARGVAHVPEGRRVIPSMTVIDNLRLGGYRFRRRADLDRRLEEVAAFFPALLGWAKRRAGTLSGGQQQLLSIARALMGRPSVLLLDEPLTGLDPIFQREVIGALDKIRSSSIAIVLVEQNARRSLDLADRALVIDSGRVVLSGRAADLKENAGVQEGYLGTRVKRANSATDPHMEGNGQ